MSLDAEAALAKLREIAMALPGAVERTSAGLTVFAFEEGEIFARFLRDGPDIAVAVKTGGEDEQAMLIERDPASFYAPADPHLSGWMAMRLADPDWDQVSDRVATSWEVVAPARWLEAGGR